MTLLMMPNADARRARYNREAVLNATPVRLLTMLYDRLLLDLNRAEAAQIEEEWQVAGENLLHAQAIVSELTTSLNVDAWNGGEGLFALYTYVSTALTRSNTHRDVARTQESIALLEPLRLTWHEAAASLPAQPAETNTTGGALGFG